MDKELFYHYMERCGLKTRAALALATGENVYAVQRWGGAKPFPAWLEDWFKLYAEFKQANALRDFKALKKEQESLNRQFGSLQAFQLRYKALKAEHSALKYKFDKLQERHKILSKEHKEMKRKMRYIDKIFDK